MNHFVVKSRVAKRGGHVEEKDNKHHDAESTLITSFPFGNTQNHPTQNHEVAGLLGVSGAVVSKRRSAPESRQRSVIQEKCSTVVLEDPLWTPRFSELPHPSALFGHRKQKTTAESRKQSREHINSVEQHISQLHRKRTMLDADMSLMDRSLSDSTSSHETREYNIHTNTSPEFPRDFKQAKLHTQSYVSDSRLNIDDKFGNEAMNSGKSVENPGKPCPDKLDNCNYSGKFYDNYEKLSNYDGKLLENTGKLFDCPGALINYDPRNYPRQLDFNPGQFDLNHQNLDRNHGKLDRNHGKLDFNHRKLDKKSVKLVDSLGQLKYNSQNFVDDSENFIFKFKKNKEE